ncbi:helix-turn-helix transcriptional regulator [Curtobacterium sp. VKM Ac-1376]|uniref:helix-turn-helix transcriptional regulator n=1 Tax=Curtobacterium sp. VKM Ac-1376 TaxID=123312 RepID=UPI00188A7341|nr:AAA family ATPase [Curtobacterium sp. VKM Ac-1376]MBF4613431.1 AAA family ATPase [Curtobacterium sp. VKM Ac-1376]
MAAVLTNEEYRTLECGAPARGLATPRADLPIRGRDAEQATVSEALTGLARGAGDVLVVRGSSGVGKSRLLEDIVTRAGAAGLRVAVGRTDRDARLIPLAPIMEALATGVRPISDRTRLGTVAQDPETRYWLLQQLQDDLERAASSSGVLVVIDDLQWCDTTTLAVLRSLSRRLADVPVLWVVAVRSEDQDPSVATTAEDLGARGRVIDLEPLSEDATSAMIADLLGAVPDETVLRAAHRAENVPLLVVELVRGLVDEHLLAIVDGIATMPGPTLPVTFGASVRATVRRLSKETQQIVQVGAVLGRSFDVESLSAMLEQPVQRLLPGLQEAIEVGVLVDDGPLLTFRHDVFREAAESMIPLAVRHALIRQAVDTLLRQGVEPRSVASRIAEVAEPGDVRAAELLRTVAVDLAATDAAQASDLALRAAELARDTAAMPGIVVDVLPLLWHSGRTAAARALLADLDGRLQPEDDARLRLALARLQTEHSAPDALRSVESALALPGLSAGLRSRLLAVRALNLANAGRHEDLQAALHESGPTVEAGADPVAVATFEASASVLAFNQGRFAEATQTITTAMSRVAAVGHASSTWLPEGLWVAFLANALGDTERAGRIAEANAIETRRNHLARPTAAWMMLRTRVLFDQGHLEDAKTLAESVLDLAEDLELGGFAALTAGSVLFRTALVQADHAAADRYRRFAEDLRADPTFERAGAWLLALEADARDAVDAAVAHSEPAWCTLESPVSSMSSPADFADDVHLARIAIRGDRLDRLDRIERVARVRAAANPENDLCTGTWLHVHGLVHGSAESLHRAVARLRRVDRKLVLAAALEDLGGALRSTSVPDTVGVWQEAAGVFHEAGAVRDAERVRGHLRGVGVATRPSSADPGVSGLTARESQVVERVAAGLTTQQIASDLFISTHTVTSHVRHVYTKWGVSSRRDLAVRFRQERPG